MSKFVVTQLDSMKLATSICEQAGIDPNLVRRMVIDLKVGNAGMIYLELFATDEMFNVDLSDVGIEIREDLT